MAEDKKVNLFIVGAMRAGTTSFMKVLEQHPEIYTSPIKEPHYFVDKLPKEVYSPSKMFSIENYFKNDFPKKLHIGHVKSHEHYEKLFSLAKNEKYRAEGSTCYLHEPNAAKKIKEYNPNAKIIILIRDPYIRAYSQYKMDIALGRERRSFEKVIKKQLTLFASGTLPWYSYTNMSCIDDAIKMYKSLFNNVCILSLENLSHYPTDSFEILTSFLGIKPILKPDLPILNSAPLLRNKEVLYTLNKLGLKNKISANLKPKIKHSILKYLIINSSSNEVISLERKVVLEKLFRNKSKYFYKYL